MPRKTVAPAWVKHELDQFKKFLEDKITEKGDLSFISSHEIRGAIQEEVDEYCTEVRKNNKDGQVNELLDIMVAAFWGVVSIRQAGTEW